MSLSAVPVPTYLVDDPRIDFDRHAAYLVERGGGDVTYRQYKCVSASTSAISFNTLVPSRDTVVSSKVYMNIPLQVTITLPAGVLTAPSVISDVTGFRFAPIVTSCNSIQLELNGKAVSSNTYRYYPALMRYCNSNDEMLNDFSCMPTFMDYYGSYYDPDNIAADPSLGGLYGTLKDPLGIDGDADSFHPTPRRGYLSNISNITVNTATQFTFSCTLQEILPISPLFWGHREVKGLVGLDTLGVTLQLRNNLSRIISSTIFNNVVGANNLTVAIDQPTLVQSWLEFVYIKPRANVILPRTIHYPYNNIKDYQSQGSTLALGATATDSFNNIQLTGVPKRVYIFAKRREQDETYATTDTFARIESISLDLGTRSGLLAECSPQVLYRMAVKNGYRGSWDAWYKHSGSVMCIDFGSDVSLDLLDAPGALKQLQMSFRLRYTNIQSNKNFPGIGGVEGPITFQLYAIVVFDGMVIFRDGEVLFESNDVSALDVADSSKVRKVAYDDIADYVYGGLYTGGSLSSFKAKVKTGLDKAKTFAQQKVIPGVQKALPYIEKGVKVAAEVLPALAALGYTEEQIFDIINGKGGKVMPKKSIKARAAKK
jgi:hypothetical protein